MNKRGKITKGGLSQKMSGFQPDPPEGIWESIAGELGGAGGARKRVIWILVAAASVVFAVSAGIFYFGENGLDKGTIVAQENVLDKRQGIASDDIKTELPQQKKSELNDRTSSVTSPEPERESFRESIRKEVIAQLESGGVEPDLNNQQPVQEIAHTEVMVDQLEVTTNTLLKKDSLSEGVNNLDAQYDPAADSMGREKIVTSPLDSLENYLLAAGDEPILEEEISGKTDDRGAWQVGAFLSPLVSYRDAASADPLQNSSVNTSESAKISYAGGFQVKYSRNDKWVIESGLVYSRQGVRIGGHSAFTGLWNDQLDAAPARADEEVISLSNSMGTIVTENEKVFVNNYSAEAISADYHLMSPTDFTINNTAVTGFDQTLEYMEIPLNVRYTVFDRNFRVEIIGGISTSLLVDNSIQARTVDGLFPLGEAQDLRRINYTGNAGLGFNYTLGESLSMVLEPRFRYSLRSINSRALPVTRPYSLGLRTGINYRF